MAGRNSDDQKMCIRDRAIVELFQGKNAADALAEKIVYTR